MLPDIDVNLVRTPENVEEFLAWLIDQINARETLALDTETTGLRWWEYSFVRLWQVGTADKGYAIPVSWWGAVIKRAMEMIAQSKIDVVLHNATFDMHAMRQEGWPLPDWAHVHDTSILHAIRRSDQSKALKGRQTADMLGGWIFKGQNALKKRAKELGLRSPDYWRHIPVDEPMYWGYGVLDTCLTRRLWDAHAETRSTYPTQIVRERQYQRIMYEVERRGLRIDTKYTQGLQGTLSEQASKELFFLREQGLANPNSNHQLEALLESDYNFVPEEFTDTGRPRLDKHVLATLAEAGGMQADVVASLIAYKRAVKWRSSYADVFLHEQDRYGRVHPSINTLGAKTGRSSITRPALQTLPSREPLIRRCVLPNKGETWWAIDYSNQEPRALAHFGQSPELLAYFNEGDGTGSIHDFVATELFGPTYSHEQRTLAKVFGLSRSYGAGAESIAKASGIPKDTVSHLLERYDNLVGLRHLNDAIYNVADNRQPTPYIVTAGGRRVYSHPEETFKLVNYLMQGTGADMLKDATIRLDEEGLAEFITIPVHDEICFSFPEDEDTYLAEKAAKVMFDDTYAVPMPVDISGPGKSWGDLYA